jgi:hypothetical protein
VFAVGVYSGKSALALSAEILSEQESGSKISLVAERSICPTGLLPKCTGRTSFKQLIKGTRLNLILLRKMSVIGPDNIKDGDCERGRVTQQPPISYTQFKYPKWLSEPDSVKVKLPAGDQYTCYLMHDASNAETYLKWFQTSSQTLIWNGLNWR